jgi:hypothetical protein
LLHQHHFEVLQLQPLYSKQLDLIPVWSVNWIVLLPKIEAFKMENFVRLYSYQRLYIICHFFVLIFLWFYPLMLFYFIYEFNIWNALLVLSKLALTFTLFSFVSAEKSLPIDLASAKI